MTEPDQYQTRSATPFFVRCSPIKRIVIIDDEPAFGELVAGVAAACGFDPRFTTDPDRFRADVAALDPTLIMLDLSMPGTDGIELLRHLAATGSSAGIVIASGFDRRVTETAVNLGRELGLNMLPPLAKPLRVEALRTLLGAPGEEAGSA